MFVAITSRLRRKNGMGVAFGIRLTKRNVLWFGFIWFMYIICYYTILLSIWFTIAIVYAFFIWPAKKIHSALKKNNQPIAPNEAESGDPIA